jgi:hypothetical protein
MKVNIYCLYDPLECKIRYVGRTRKPIQIRLIEHISKSKYHSIYFPEKPASHKVNWINKLLEKGIQPKIRKLTEIDGWKESHVFEKQLIDKYKEKYNLLNSQDRGSGPESKIVNDSTKLKISNTLKEKHKNNEIRKNEKKLFMFNDKGELIHEEKSITLGCIYLNVSKRTIQSKLKSKKSINGIFISTSNKLNLDDYLYIFNYCSKEIKIFSTFLEIMNYLNISEHSYKKLNNNKKLINGWIINSSKPNLKKKITLEKDGIDYSFDSIKEAANHIGCVVYALYDLIKGRTNKIYNYKIKNQ